MIIALPVTLFHVVFKYLSYDMGEMELYIICLILIMRYDPTVLQNRYQPSLANINSALFIPCVTNEIIIGSAIYFLFLEKTVTYIIHAN